MQIRDRLPLLILPLAAVIAILPLLLHGCSCGHDLSFHLLSWQEAAQQFARGTLHPRWAYSAAYGAGEPRLVFYPPLSWTLGGLLTLAARRLAGAVRPGAVGVFFAYDLNRFWPLYLAAGVLLPVLLAKTGRRVQSAAEVKLGVR